MRFCLCGSFCLMLAMGVSAFADDTLDESQIERSLEVDDSTAMPDEEYDSYDHYVIGHVLESQKLGKDPIEWACCKDDLPLVEALLELRENDLARGKPTWDFPGYRFLRRWKGGQLPAWMRKVRGRRLNNYGVTQPTTFNRLDISLIKLLMKYDHENTWYYDFGKWGNHSFQFCDLEALVFLHELLAFEWPEKPPVLGRFANEQEAAKNSITNLHGRAANWWYLVDPFLVDFAVDTRNPTHFFDGSNSRKAGENRSSYRFYRSDDTEQIRELKARIMKLQGVGFLESDEPLIKY